MFYVLHGTDGHSQRDWLSKQLEKLGDPDLLALNTTRFGSGVTLTELQQACGAMPFLAKARIVIVEELLSSVPDKALVEGLEAWLPEMPESARLVFLESKPLPDSNRLLKLAGQTDQGYVKRFDVPQGPQLERWIQRQTEAIGAQITPRAAQLLAANISPSQPPRAGDPNPVAILEVELEKLAMYVGSGGTIDVEDVILLSPYAAEASIFDLVDALGSRQAAVAATLLQKKLSEGAEPFYLFTMFVRQFRLLIQVKEMAEAGERPPGMAAQLRVPPFVAGKLAQQAAGFSLPQLEQIYERLLEIDVDTKTGQADMLTSLHLLLAGLTPELD
jgi:DNA polymerase-3 subunit delta